MMAMFLSTVISLLVASLAVVSGDTCGNSTLHCYGDGIPCLEGDADFSLHPRDPFNETFFFLKTTNMDGYYCDCPDNLTGLRCAREYEKCDGADHFCYHGGKCIKGLNDKVSENELFCDCSDAKHNGIPYKGKYCEVELEQCGGTDSEIYCANNGNCKDDFANKLRPCDCDPAHRGPHCEFDDGHVPECNLECDNGGECARGIKTYSTALHNDFFARHDGNFMYCDCPEGYYGLKCEARAEACGDAQCFHGGKCIQSKNSKNETIDACDCSEASHEGVPYIGQYCQSPVTKKCSEDGANGQFVCANEGECKDEAHEGCTCKDGFHGDQCEHHASMNETDVTNCNLDCRNDGNCRVGKKDTSLFSDFEEPLQEAGLKKHTDIGFQYCVCPEGYFGILCEHKLDICPGGEHICLHGSRCVGVNETTDLAHECDCKDGFDSLKTFAGKFCQYESTDICTKSRQPGLGKSKMAFCVNNGKCKGRVEETEDHPGCDCPDKYAGPHCEYLKGRDHVPSARHGGRGSSEDGPNMPILVSMAVILVALIVVVTLMICTGKKKKKLDKASDSVLEDAEQMDPEVEDYDSGKQGTPAASAESKIPNLQNVEII
eukprot:scaffold3827_cov179-Cylindrotheca_fusiformis.AAC.32